MSDKIFLKDITLPIIETGENETYSFVQTDSDLEMAGDAADAKKTGDEITQLKADLTAVETDIETGNLTAGTAKQLLSDEGMTDKSPYLFRAMPTGAGDREEPVIVGGSVVWNQLNGVDAMRWSSSGYNGITVTKVDSATVHVSGTATADAQARAYTVPNYVLTPRVNHVLYIKSGDSRVCMYVGNGTSNYSELITRPTAIGENVVFFKIPSGTDFGTNGIDIKPQIYDLTEMFGSTIAEYIMTLPYAPATDRIDFIKKYGFFTKDYYPFCEPTFKHVEGLVSHKMVGFNQWDEEWEAGGLNINDGEKQTASDRIRSKNFIHVLPNTTYYLYIGAEHHPSGGNSTNDVVFYDENKAYIGYSNPRQTYSFTFTTPANCHYIMFHTSPRYGDTYYHDICVNLSDPAKNGTYEPYKEYTYLLDPDVVLRGMPKLDSANNLYFDGDTYKPDGMVSRRYEIVDLGALSWDNNGENKVVASIANKKIGSQNIIADNFTRVPATTDTGNMTNGQIKAYADSRYITLYLTGITAANASTMLSGKYLLYELDTPTTETADLYAPLQLADPYGAEEWVLADGAFPMPVGQETFYPENLRAKIEGLPWNFASLIAPTETTLTATRAYTTGQLFIVDNVLYQATTSIASGGTITPGTNCTATTLAEIISAL